MAEAAPASAVSLGMKLGGIAALNVVFTFGFQWFVLTRLGPGVQSDALFAATMVPQLVLVVLSGSLTHVLVPLLSTTEDAFTHSDSWMFFQGAALIFGGAAIVLALAASLWVPLTVPGFTDLQTVLTVHLVRIARESVVAVGDLPAGLQRVASHGNLFARIAGAALVPAGQ